MLALLLALAVPFLAGFLLFSLLPPLRRGGPGRFVLKGSLAVGWGFGVSSCLLLAWLVLAGAPGWAYALADTGFFLILAAASLVVLSRRGTATPPAADPAPTGKVQTVLTVAVWFAVVAKFLQFVLRSLLLPHGLGDASFIWNMRARFLYRGGDFWRDAFAADPVACPHMDYPLLVPLSVVRCWHYLGRETTLGPALVALLFTFATVGVLYGALALLRGRSQGCVGALILLSLPLFVKLGYDQYADVPLSFYFLSTAVLFCLHDALAPDDARWLVLAGTLAGSAAWTKNEGLLFLACLPLARLAVVVRRRGWRAYAHEMLAFALGLVPVACALVYFKFELAPRNELVAAQSWQVAVGRLAESSRYGQILAALGRESVLTGGFLLPLYFLFLGRARGKSVPAAGFVPLLLGLMLLGYVMVYAMTPQDLAWHLRTSLGRLLIQLWPLTLFVFFLHVASPEEALSANRVPSPAARGYEV
jgi:dolichyl-phosphate-mannose-protein mannosyltransferase